MSNIKDSLRYTCECCEQIYERHPLREKEKFSTFKKHICKGCASKENKEIEKSKIKGIKYKDPISGRLKYEKVTIVCEFCHKDFKVDFGKRATKFCSKTCSVKGRVVTSVKNKSNCIECGKEFEHYGQCITCSGGCYSSYMSKARIGENNPAWKEPSKANCKHCKEDFLYKRDGRRRGSIPVFCSIPCRNRGFDKNSNDSNIDKSLGYPREWRIEKELIKKRDNGCCCLCGIKQEDAKTTHHVHHIDYDKKNLDHSNLVTLCQNCHNATHNGRTFWEIIFRALMSNSKIVRKDWGCEVHIVNHKDYCLKYLIFFKGKEFSFHFHNEKKELWHCLYGIFDATIGYEEDKFKFKAGDKIEVERGIPHQLRAIRNSILVEVSTQSFPEDSIRIREANNN